MRWGCLLIFCSVALRVLAAEGMKVEVYPLGMTDFEVAAKVAGGIVSSEGKLVADKEGNRLIVYETPKRHEALRRALSELKTPIHNVRIRVSFQDHASRESTGFGAEGRGAVGPVVIQTGPRRSGGGLAMQMNQAQIMDSSYVEQELLVMSGGKARLVVGSEVPYADWFWEIGLRWGLWNGNVRWREVGAQMVVEPYVMDDRIRIRLTPEFSYVIDGRHLTTAVEKLTTEVVVADGQTVDLGGLNVSDKEFYSRFLTDGNHLGGTRALNIRLTPTIE